MRNNKTKFNKEDYMDTHSFSHYIKDFEMFASLPSNTQVHLATDGHFIATGGNYSGMPLVQASANWWKGHTDEKLVSDIDTFGTHVLTSLNEQLDRCLTAPDEPSQKKAFSDLFLARQLIQRSAGNDHSGMNGLLNTYPKGSQAHESWDCLIKNLMRTSDQCITQAVKKLNINPSVLEDSKERTILPFCPESEFSNEDWEKTMSEVQSLREESIGAFKKYGQFAGALMYTEANVAVGSWNHWDKIITFDNGTDPANQPSLYLGALPLVKGVAGRELRNDLEQLKEIGVGAVLSVVEVFENNSEGYITSAVTPQQWKEGGIKQLQLPTPDFETISLEQIQRGVAFIDWNIQNNRSVYVHCKAGRGRSALIEMCYLIKHHEYTADEAFKLIRENRKQAGFKDTDSKMQTLKEFETLCNASKALDRTHKDSITTKIDARGAQS